MKISRKAIEIVMAVALIVVVCAIPVIAGWGDGQAVFGENGQKIDANTVGQIDIVDDTDAVTLLTFGLKSENTYSDVENDNQIVINLMEAKNSANEDVLYATLTSIAGNITNGVEAASIVIKAQVAGTLTTLLTIDSTGITVVGDLSSTTLGGITEANLVDKAATETVAGAWTFSNASVIMSTLPTSTNGLASGRIWADSNVLTVVP